MAEIVNPENVKVAFQREEFTYNLGMVRENCDEKQLVLNIEAENINTKELWSTTIINDENSANLKPVTILKIFHNFQTGNGTWPFGINFPQNFDIKKGKPLELSISIYHTIEEFRGKCPIELEKVFISGKGPRRIAYIHCVSPF